jgi:hypothetical protein
MKTFFRVFCLALSLAWLTTSAAFAQPKVLICGSDYYQDYYNLGTDVINKLNASGQFSQVDYFDNRYTAPTLAQLQGYDAVLAYTDFAPAGGTGDVLAQYVDGGGGVVIAMFGMASYWGFDGNIATSSYECLSMINNNTDYSGYHSMGTVSLPSHPIMNGVSTFDGGSGSYRIASTTLATGAYTIASWNDGEILIAAREDAGTSSARRVDLNFFPPSTDASPYFGLWSANTNGALIMANSLTWVAGGGSSECTAPAVTTDPSSQSACNNSSVSFSAAASGTSPATQWQVSTNNGGSWTDISGETSGTLNVTATTSMNGYQYHAVCTNACGTATSAAATLTVGALPTISVALSSTTLTPPNHSMRNITATVNTTGCSYCGGLTVTLVSITSNEADNGLGDGDTPNDIQGASTGTDDRAFSLRAERSGRGSGRVYTATYSVSDCAGNTATASATVSVAH